YGELAQQRESLRAEAEAQHGAEAFRRSMSASLATLKIQIIEMEQSPDHQERGRALERILTSLFTLWDLTPRGPFVLRGEQIDGAFTFDTDDYIFEARWRKEVT